MATRCLTSCVGLCCVSLVAVMMICTGLWDSVIPLHNWTAFVPLILGGYSKFSCILTCAQHNYVHVHVQAVLLFCHSGSKGWKVSLFTINAYGLQGQNGGIRFLLKNQFVKLFFRYSLHYRLCDGRIRKTWIKV